MKTFLSGIVISVLLLFGAARILTVQAFTVSNYDGLVNDYANVLSADMESKLEVQLSTMAVATDGAELAVVTIPTLEGDTVENVAQVFFDTWKIGKKNKDNGLLLLVAVDDRKVRTHLGYGTETVITDSTAGAIIREVITPPFKGGNFEKGILEGVDTLSFYLANPNDITTAPQTSTAEDDTSVWVILFLTFMFTFGIPLLAYGAAFFGRSTAWWPRGVVGFVLGALIGNWPVGIFFGVVGLFLGYILSKNFTTWKLQDKATSWSKTYGGFSSSNSWSSGSSSSSSGFSSFGGGSSGGGGASGGW